MSVPRARAAGSGAQSASPERLGRYDILGRIAVGGMAELHLARAVGIEGFQKICVVKRILPHLARNREFVEMFLDEARLAATLHHSNIVQVFDIGSAGGSYFLAMEFLHGEDARRILRAVRSGKRTLPLEHAVGIVLGACAGLHYAHEKAGPDGAPLGIVHRDVSPQNVFVTYDGQVKLVDFGIAKATRRLTETRSGTLKGKLRYMSPEQCRSEPLDRRSDVFSLGILLWELSTGRRLYSGGEFEILKKIVEIDAPRPSAEDPAYPVELERIVLRALRRDREGRYQTAQEMQLALEEFARERKLAVSPVALARYMRELFGDKIDAWTAAQREGKALADHMKDVLEHSAEWPQADRDCLLDEEGIRTDPSMPGLGLGPFFDPLATSRPLPADAPAVSAPTHLLPGRVERTDAARRARWPLWLGAFGVVGAATLAVLLWRPAAPPAPGSQRPAAPSSPAPAPAPIVEALPREPVGAARPADTPAASATAPAPVPRPSALGHPKRTRPVATGKKRKLPPPLRKSPPAPAAAAPPPVDLDAPLPP